MSQRALQRHISSMTSVWLSTRILSMTHYLARQNLLPPPLPTRCPPPKLTPLAARHLPLPLRLTDAPPSIAARAARMTREQRWAQVQDPYKNTVLAGVNPDGSALDRYDITKRDITQLLICGGSVDRKSVV